MPPPPRRAQTAAVKKENEEKGGKWGGAPTAAADENHSGTNDQFSFLAPFWHEWVIENYQKVAECLHAKHLESEWRHQICEDCDHHRCSYHRETLLTPNILGSQHRSVVREWGQQPDEDPLYNIHHVYGPIQIGRTKWILELRMPSFELWLKRDEYEGGNVEERLAFRVSMGYVHCAGGKCVDHMKEPSPLPDFLSEATFGAVNNNKVRLGQVPSDYSKMRLVFEALVRPENMMGAPCDFRVVVLDKNGEGGKVLAEFDVHRSVLREGSPVFRAMLGEDSKFEEAKTGVLKIVGQFAPETIKHLLAFIYVGKKVLSSDFGRRRQGEEPTDEQFLELVDAAEQYQLDDDALKLECGRRLLALINPGNAMKLLAKAELYGLQALKLGALRYIRKNWLQVSGAGARYNYEMMRETLPVNLVIELVQVLLSTPNSLIDDLI